MNMSNTARCFVGLSLLAACEKSADPSVGRQAAQEASANVQSGTRAVERLTSGLARAVEGTSAPVGAAMGDSSRLRRALRDLHDDHTPLGRELTLYPTSFIAAVRPDGKGAASDRSAAPDPLIDVDLAEAFPCVRRALQGTAGSCGGQFSLVEGSARRWFVAVVPTRPAAGEPVNGAVVAAMTFGNVAKAVRGALEMERSREPVQLAVGLLHEGRTYPSGADNDVPARFLVRPAMVRAIPASFAAAAARAPQTFTFTENGGRMQWGVASAPAPALGEGAALMVFRAPLRQ